MCSVLGGEVFTFSDAVDEAFMIRHDLRLVLGRSIPLRVLTDSALLFNFITK